MLYFSLTVLICVVFTFQSKSELIFSISMAFGKLLTFLLDLKFIPFFGFQALVEEI